MCIRDSCATAKKMAEKRKRVVLDLNQKIEIIKRLKKDETPTSIALICGVGRTTVNDIKCDTEKIEQHVSKMQNIDGDPKTHKTMKSAKYDQLDTVMYQWFIPVSYTHLFSKCLYKFKPKRMFPQGVNDHFIQFTVPSYCTSALETY